MAIKGAVSSKDSRYAQQAKAIGATVRDGKWYDANDGHYIDQNEADRRTNERGVAVDGLERGRGGLAGMWDRNRNAIGQTAQFLAPIAGALTGGLGGVALGGIGSALGSAAKKGTNFGDILGSGAIGAGGAYLGGKAVDGWQGASGQGIGSQASNALRSAFTTGSSGGGLAPGANISNVANASATGVSAPPLVGGASGLSRAASFAGRNALPIGQAAQGMMAAREAGARNAAAGRAQDFEERQYTEEQERRRKVAQYLAPLFQQLTGNMNLQFAPSSART